MSDIFISYASQDRPKAQVLAQALRQHGWTIWWDRTIPSGKRFDQVIQDALADARCVVVLWSKQSVTSDWVLEEAEEGRKRQVLVPVLIEEVVPPMGFRRIQAADLIDWNGAEASPSFKKLAADIEGILGPRPTKPKQEKRRQSERHAATGGTLATGTPTKAGVDQLLQKDIDLELPKHKPEIGKMVRIPTGEFLYGDKKAKHVLPEYYIDIHPVTNAEYKRFVDGGGYNKPEYWTEGGWRWIQEEGHQKPKLWDDKKYEAFNRPDHPVVGVSWYEAWAYAKWAGKRLPTELEWEKAARSVDGRKYPWGDTFDPERCNTKESRIRSTTPVTRYETGKSAHGCYDMVGNVWEWTSSLHKSYPYRPDDGREDPSASATESRVLRGGSWSNAAGAPASLREWRYPYGRGNNIGFRCAKTP